MKKIALIIAAGLLLGGTAFAKEENGALGFGILSEGAKDKIVAGSLRGNIFLDIGYQLAGPLFYGFEFQGDVKKMSESNFTITQTDATYFDLGGGDALIFFNTSTYNTTYTLWDLDFSPRGYLSFDLGDKIQVLGFAGLNYNWQTLDYEIKEKNGNSFTYGGKTVAAGDSYKTSENVGNGFWSIVAGFRVSVGAFYADFTRFLDDTGSQVSWNSYTKNRLGLGINLRF